MVSSDFVRMIKEDDGTPKYRKYVEQLARQHRYILNWNKGFAVAEGRCGWMEEMQRDREAVRRARARGCF